MIVLELLISPREKVCRREWKSLNYKALYICFSISKGFIWGGTLHTIEDHIKYLDLRSESVGE